MSKKILCMLFLFGTLRGETLGKPGCFAISADCLIVTASIDQPYYVVSSSSNVVLNGKRYGNHQSWHKGYRVEALYRFSNCLTDARVRWTHIPRFSDHNKVSGSNLFGVFSLAEEPIAGAKGDAILSDHFNVFALDFLLSQTLFNFRNFRFAFQGGVEYGYARLFEEVIFSTTEIGPHPRIVQVRSKTSGAGPMLGVDFSFKILRWLSITGRGSGAFLAAKRGSTFFDNGSTIGPGRLATNVTNSPYWFVIPTSNLRLGLAVCTPCDFRRWFDCSPVAALGCLKIDLEVGYEFLSFYRAFDRMFFSDDTVPGSSVDELMDCAFHGPYLHLGLTF
jgi:hypothetical protein